MKAKKEAIKEKNPYFVATFCVYFAEALYLLSREYDHDHNLKHGRQELKQAIRLFRKGNYKRNLANTLKFLGSWERRTGQYEYCTEPLEESIELYETLHDHESVSDACTELGLAEQSLGNTQQAIAHLEKAVEQYERNYREIRKPGLKTVFFGDQRQVPHRNLLSLYLEACMPEQAWLTVQKIRGRSLLIMLSTSDTEFAGEDFSSQDMFDCYQEFRILENDQNILWEKWQKQEMQSETEISTKTWDQYAEGERRYQELFLKLENEPKFNFIRSQKPVSYAEMAELLGK